MDRLTGWKKLIQGNVNLHTLSVRPTINAIILKVANVTNFIPRSVHWQLKHANQFSAFRQETAAMTRVCRSTGRRITHSMYSVRVFQAEKLLIAAVGSSSLDGAVYHNQPSIYASKVGGPARDVSDLCQAACLRFTRCTLVTSKV